MKCTLVQPWTKLELQKTLDATKSKDTRFTRRVKEPGSHSHEHHQNPPDEGLSLFRCY